MILVTFSSIVWCIQLPMLAAYSNLFYLNIKIQLILGFKALQAEIS